MYQLAVGRAGADNRKQPALINAGAPWTDEPVAGDHPLVTSRKPDDLPQFNEAVIEMFAAQNR